MDSPISSSSQLPSISSSTGTTVTNEGPSTSTVNGVNNIDNNNNSNTINVRDQRLTKGSWPPVLDLYNESSQIISPTSSTTTSSSSSTLVHLSSTNHLLDRQTILKHIWDTGIINVYCCTWNMHGKVSIYYLISIVFIYPNYTMFY